MACRGRCLRGHGDAFKCVWIRAVIIQTNITECYRTDPPLCGHHAWWWSSSAHAFLWEMPMMPRALGLTTSISDSWELYWVRTLQEGGCSVYSWSWKPALIYGVPWKGCSWWWGSEVWVTEPFPVVDYGNRSSRDNIVCYPFIQQGC